MKKDHECEDEDILNLLDTFISNFQEIKNNFNEYCFLPDDVDETEDNKVIKGEVNIKSFVSMVEDIVVAELETLNEFIN